MSDRSSNRTGGDLLAEQLVAEGVEHLFGVPGVQLDFAVDGLAKQADQLTFINTRHEQAATYMADGYARTSDRPGVAMVVPGPGVLNAGAGLCTAYACNSRMVLIAGQIPSELIGGGLGALHEIPQQTEFLKSQTKWHTIATSADDIPRAIHEAFVEVMSGQPRPVVVEVTPDALQAATVATTIAAEAPRPAARPDEGAVAEAARLLAASTRPVIYAGGGAVAARCSEALAALAERLEAPVVMSPNGRGSLSNRHRLALTSLAGREVLPQADVVLVVGSRFVDGHGGIVPTGDHSTHLHLNVDPTAFGAPRRPVVELLADAGAGLHDLLAALDAVGERPSREAEIARARARAAEQIAAIEPQLHWMNALRRAIPDDGVLVNELTQVGYLSQVGFDVYSPVSYLTPGYQGTLGYGFATALGAKSANPDRPVVSITGDGGFGWNLQELSTARQFNIGLVTVVFNDGAFGNVRRTQMTRFDGRIAGTTLTNPEFAMLAEAFGVASYRAEDPDALEKVLDTAIAANEPALVEVPVGPMPSAWHLLLDFLAKPSH